MHSALCRPYVSVAHTTGPSFGGSQMWEVNPTQQAYGCGVTACADLLLYCTGRTKLGLDEYMDFRHAVSAKLPPTPHLGISGVRLALTLRYLFQEYQLPYTCFWAASKKKFLGRVHAMLQNDIPVIFSVGPNFPRFWEGERVPLYRVLSNGTLERSGSAISHYMTITGLDADRMEISSWGERHILLLSEYDAYVRTHSAALFSNCLQVYKK